MAVSNLNKAHVYDLLGHLDASFARVIRNLAELGSTGTFNPKIVRAIGWQSRELQANPNLHLLETLRDVEQAGSGAIWGGKKNQEVKPSLIRQGDLLLGAPLLPFTFF